MKDLTIKRENRINITNEIYNANQKLNQLAIPALATKLDDNYLLTFLSLELQSGLKSINQQEEEFNQFVKPFKDAIATERNKYKSAIDDIAQLVLENYKTDIKIEQIVNPKTGEIKIKETEIDNLTKYAYKYTPAKEKTTGQISMEKLKLLAPQFFKKKIVEVEEFDAEAFAKEPQEFQDQFKLFTTTKSDPKIVVVEKDQQDGKIQDSILDEIMQHYWDEYTDYARDRMLTNLQDTREMKDFLEIKILNKIANKE